MAKSKYFRDASEPCSDMAAILLALDDGGEWNVEMRDALCQHAENALATIPQNIAALARVLAAASSSGGAGETEVTAAAYGIAEMADLLRCFQMMHEEFYFKKNRGDK